MRIRKNVIPRPVITERDKYNYNKSHSVWCIKYKRNLKRVLSLLDRKYCFYMYLYNFKMRYTDSKDIPFSRFSSEELIAKRIDGELVKITVDINRRKIVENELYTYEKTKIELFLKGVLNGR